jgi:hypothetical protein
MSERQKVSLGGYTLDKRRSLFRSLAWSRLARFSLALAQWVAALNCVAIVILGLYGCFVGGSRNDGEVILGSLVGAGAALLLQFAMLVVFARAADMKPE